MKGTILTGAFVVASCMILSDATFLIAPLAVPLAGGALGGLALLKLSALKGLAVGAILGGALGGGGGGGGGHGGGHRGYRHRKRSVDDLESLLLLASTQDTSDCAKKLVCEVHGLSSEVQKSPEELMIIRLFNSDALDLSKGTVEFDLAAQIGKRVGGEQCSIVYERCPHNRQKLMDLFEDPKLGNVA